MTAYFMTVLSLGWSRSRKHSIAQTSYRTRPASVVKKQAAPRGNPKAEIRNPKKNRMPKCPNQDWNGKAVCNPISPDDSSTDIRLPFIYLVIWAFGFHSDFW